MSEEWRNSEAQLIRRGQWTKLNGTDAEILIPHEGSAGGGSAGSGVSIGGGGAGSPAGQSGGGAVGFGGSNTISGGGGSGGAASDQLVIRVRRATSTG